MLDGVQQFGKAFGRSFVVSGGEAEIAQFFAKHDVQRGLLQAANAFS